MKSLVPALLLLTASLLITAGGCKKCVTCTARDVQTNDVRFEATTCARGPLLDDWIEGVKASYPESGYNTVCE